jgi:NAD-dependent SIR2 family protein deacetylase
MAGPMMLSTRTVYRDEMIRCTRCKNPYVSMKMFKKVSGTIPGNEDVISLCPKCRQTKIYEKIFGSSVPSSPQVTLRPSAQAVIKEDAR